MAAEQVMDLRDDVQAGFKVRSVYTGKPNTLFQIALLARTSAYTW